MFFSRVLVGLGFFLTSFSWGNILPVETEVESSTNAGKKALDFNDQEIEKVSLASDKVELFELEHDSTQSPTNSQKPQGVFTGFEWFASKQHIFLQHLTPQQAKRMSNNWEDNEANVLGLGMQAFEMKKTFQDLQEAQHAIKNQTDNDAETKEKYLNVEIQLNELTTKILELIQLKLMELGTNDYNQFNKFKIKTNKKFTQLLKTLPPELFPSIRMQGFSNHLESIKDKIKQIILDQQEHMYYDPFTNNVENVAAKLKFDYLFQTIEFLWMERYISKNDLKVMFQDEKVLKLSTIYFFLGFKNILPQSCVRNLSPSLIMDHFLWKVRFTFWDALGEDVKKRMNFELLVSGLYLKLNKLKKYSFYDREDLKRFMESFDKNNYLKYMQYTNNNPQNPTLFVDHSEGQLNEINSKIQKDFEHLVQIFLWSTSIQGPRKLKELTQILCEIIAFIDENIIPGILHNTFRNLGNKSLSSKYIHLQFELILIPSRLNSIMDMGMDFYGLLLNKEISHGFLLNKEISPNSVESILLDYQDKAIFLNTQLCKTYDKIEYRFKNLSTWSKKNPQASKVNQSSFEFWIEWLSFVIDENNLQINKYRQIQ